jgi:hypothetical protein
MKCRVEDSRVPDFTPVGKVGGILVEAAPGDEDAGLV